MSVIRKDVAQRIHARRRAMERFGVDPEPHTYRRILQEIWSGTARFCWRTSLRVTVFETELAGKPCRVAYDKQRKQIVTFMTVEESEHDRPDRRAELHREDDLGRAPSAASEHSGREVQRAG